MCPVEREVTVSVEEVTVSGEGFIIVCLEHTGRI